MRILSQIVIIVGACLGVFALVGLYSHAETEGFLGLDIVVLQIDLLIGMFVLSLGLAMMLCFFALDRVIERAARREAETADGHPPQEDIPLCPSCLTPAKLNQHFCMKCWTPLTSHAEIDPLGRVYATGDMYWKLTRGPSKPIALIGLVLLVGPLLMVFLIGTVAFICAFVAGGFNRLPLDIFGVEGILGLLAGLVFLAIQLPYVLIFIKAIRNRHRQVPREIPCFEFQEDGKEIESAADDSGDQKHPPSDPTAFRENRGDI